MSNRTSIIARLFGRKPVVNTYLVPAKPSYAISEAEAAYVERIKAAHPHDTIAWSRDRLNGLTAQVLGGPTYPSDRMRAFIKYGDA